MKKSKTLLFGDYLQEKLFSKDPELWNYLVARRIMEHLPQILGKHYKFLSRISYNEQVLYLYVKTPAAQQAFQLKLQDLKEQVDECLAPINESLRDLRIFR